MATHATNGLLSLGPLALVTSRFHTMPLLRTAVLAPSRTTLPDLVAPLFVGARAARITHDVQTFMQARPRDLGSGDLSDIAQRAGGWNHAALFPRLTPRAFMGSANAGMPRRRHASPERER